MKTIKDTYHDALFFASASQNEKESFYLTGAEFRFLTKLIHYGNKQKNITWTSEQIGDHLWMTVGAIDSLVKKLRVKGYINTSFTQTGEKTRSRTIWINWTMIEAIDTKSKETQEFDLEDDSTMIYEDDNTAILNTVTCNRELTPAIDEISQPVASNEEIEIVQEYSDILFRLNNGKDVKIMTDLIEYWHSIKDMKGLIKTLKTNHSQITFDLELKENYIKKINKNYIYSN